MHANMLRSTKHYSKHAPLKVKFTGEGCIRMQPSPYLLPKCTVKLSIKKDEVLHRVLITPQKVVEIARKLINISFQRKKSCILLRVYYFQNELPGQNNTTNYTIIREQSAFTLDPQSSKELS